MGSRGQTYILLYRSVVEGVVKVESLLVAVLRVGEVPVGPVPVVFLERAGPVHGEPPGPLPAKPLLVDKF